MSRFIPICLISAALSVLGARASYAEELAPSVSEVSALAGEIPELSPAPELGSLVGRPIRRVEVHVLGSRWGAPATVRSVRPGEPLTQSAARRAAKELLQTGAYARASMDAVPEGDEAVLRVHVLPRRLVAKIRVRGSVLDDEEMLREVRLTNDAEITAPLLDEIAERIRAHYRRHGFPDAQVSIVPRDTDDPMRVAIEVHIDPKAARTVDERTLVDDGPAWPFDPELDEELRVLRDAYDVDRDDRADEALLSAADRNLAEKLRARGYHRAKVAHELVTENGKTRLVVRFDTGPKFVTRYEGLRSFDADQLDRALELETEPDRGIFHLASKIREHYVKNGFFDVRVEAEERGGPNDRVHVLFFRIHEGKQVRVRKREVVCMPQGGPLSEQDVLAEIDAFLAEELPGAGIGAVDPGIVDDSLGPTHGRGTRPVPLELEPEATFHEETYERALKQVQGFLRSEGYLSAVVGPLEIVRRTCDRRSPPGQCIPLPLPVEPKSVCAHDALGLPTEEPSPDPRLQCVPDPAKGIECEPRMSLRIPIKLGPRTTLWDIAFDGNEDPKLPETKLAEMADLVLGGPVSQMAIEAARRRILDAFKEEGYAFAEVKTSLDVSPDRTRARVRFSIRQGERVVIDAIRVRGAQRTDEDLILRRVALQTCPPDTPPEDCVPYRPSDVRTSEERIATLGVFSSVSISLEDPHVPAKRKVAIVEVRESLPQYLDIKPGFSTGEGGRIGFEYGHRNIGGRAVQLTLRLQLAYLPDAFIFEPEVRENLARLSVGDRLERRNTVSLAFPEIGLGPLVRLGLDVIDVRDNFRDFGLTKEAMAGTLTYRPWRQFYAQLGVSFEYNDVGIFKGGTVDEYLAASQNRDLARLLRVPDGKTFAFAQRVGFTWDRRDNAFGAKSGTLLSLGVEHVYAFPEDIGIGSDPNANAIRTDFFRFTGTASGYVRLTQRGLSLAASLRAGRIVQSGLVPGSKTYPDRLFFLGGVDSLRGFFQDALVPQDLADRILNEENQAMVASDPSKLTVDRIALRGGNVYVNPRLELRIPMSGIFEAGIFLDAGNLWVDPASFDLFDLRYAAGAGLRISTPIGPIAFDYGINLDRRPWEEFGAFHFSIGLF